MTDNGEVKEARRLWWPELDGLRSLAFILVYYHHTVGLFWRDNPGTSPLYNFLYHADRRLHNWGWVGVDLFFVLSAFLITSLLLQERERSAEKTISLKKFLARRIWRIWPLYFFYLLLVAVLSIFLPAAYTGANLTDPKAITQLFCFAAFIGNFAVIAQGVVLHLLNPMWSLCIEEQFYIVWGASMKLIKKDILLLAILVTAGIAAPALRYYLWQHDSKNYLAYYLNSLTHCDAIVCGGIAAFVWRKYAEKLKCSPLLQGVCAAATALFLLPLTFVPYIEESDVSIVWTMSSIAVGFVGLLLTTMSNKFVRSFFALPFLTHIGRLTYGLYIFHFLVIYSLVFVSGRQLHITSQTTYILISWPLGLALTYCLARLSWRLIEAPCLAIKERYKA
ncbi:MAG: acyltransferase [Cyanobacteria bacterium SZAS TMP-1]|nr:acyltransferase [Cyanobacteria bacterium SZAS TMP-1]